MASQKDIRTPEALLSFRAEIDAIDNALVALLHKRYGVVQQVAQLKHAIGPQPCHIRAGREAEMHRDIYQRFENSPFHPEAALAIWRHIITASTHMESPLHLAAPDHLRGLVEGYFGDYTPCASWNGAIPESATVLCAPYPDNASSSYWQAILKSPQPWQVFSYAPLIINSDTPRALLLACIDAEPSGDDISYFMGGEPPDDAIRLWGDIWSVAGYSTAHEGARFLGAHATPITRKEPL
jgi:chorismate mutase